MNGIYIYWCPICQKQVPSPVHGNIDFQHHADTIEVIPISVAAEQLTDAKIGAKHFNDVRALYRGALAEISMEATEPSVLKIVRKALTEADALADAYWAARAARQKELAKDSA